MNLAQNFPQNWLNENVLAKAHSKLGAFTEVAVRRYFTK